MARTYYHVTTTGADTKTGADWAHAMDLAAFVAWIDSADFAVDSTYYFKSGEYTLTGALNITDRDGTAVAPVCIIGVKAATTNEGANVVLSDWESGATRPTFTCAANAFSVGNYYKIYNCIFTGTANPTLSAEVGIVLYNCKISNTYGSARTALQSSNYARVINCEVTSTAGGGINTSTPVTITVAYTYIRDCGGTGVSCGNNSIILFNVIDTCVTGIYLEDSANCVIANNTIYNTTTAISATSAYAICCINNIIDTAGDGIKWTTQTDINLHAYNHVGNSTDPMWNTVEATFSAHKDNWVTGGTGDDPEFNDEANGDFKLAATSPCIDAGMSLTLGCSTASEMNQGAWEATTAAASGSSPRFGDMTGGLK
jgi:parallel beta-helix repeat protein